MEVKLLLLTFYFNGRCCSFCIGKPAERMSNFWMVFKKRIRTEFRFSTHPYILQHAVFILLPLQSILWLAVRLWNWRMVTSRLMSFRTQLRVAFMHLVTLLAKRYLHQVIKTIDVLNNCHCGMTCNKNSPVT